MSEELYEQYASLYDQQAEVGEEAVVGAVRSAFRHLSREYKEHLRSLVSPRRPPASQQQLTSAQEQMEAARDLTTHLIAITLSDAFGALVDFPHIETDNSNKDDNEQLSEAVKNEASSEPGHSGPPSIIANTVSPLTRRSPGASARNVNYAGVMENSVVNQQDILTGSRKCKRSIGRSGKSNSPKRNRQVTPPIVASETDDSDSESEDDDDDVPEPKAVSLGIIVRRLNCRVPGCKKEFPSKVQLDGHLLVKHAIEKHACKVKDCTESYATNGELTTHRNTAHDNLDTDWPCGQCEVTRNTYRQLYTHTSYNHEYGLFACSADKCNYTEKTRKKVENHLRNHRRSK